MINPYQVKTEFTVWEASAAILGIKRNHSDDFPEIHLVAIELIRSIERGQLKAKRLVPLGRYVNITMSNGMQSDIDGLYFAAIQKADLLAWCESKDVKPPLLFPENYTSHKPVESTREQTIQALEDQSADKSIQSALREAGRVNATRQHLDRTTHHRQAKETARRLWLEGDRRQHSAMATDLLEMPAFRNLNKDRLLGDLKDVATQLKRPDLIRGIKKLPG